MKRAAFLFVLLWSPCIAQESLSNFEREKILKMFPVTQAEKLQERARDEITKKNGEVIPCTVVGLKGSDRFKRCTSTTTSPGRHALVG